MAQDSDVIRGRILDPDGNPVEGARVTATSFTTAVSRAGRTGRNGRFTIIFPGDEGRYMITVSMIGFLVRSFELRRAVDEDILIADATLSKVQLEPVVVSAPVRSTVGRGSTTADVGGTDIGIPANSLTAAQTGDLTATAASIPGVLSIDGTSAGGFSVLGLDAADNSITVNGMTFDGNLLPREAGVTTSLVTNPYDVSRGGFSGAQLAVRTAGGSNVITRGMSLNLIAPQLSWTDRASRAEGRDSTNLSLSGVLAGPFSYNNAYYRISYQYDRSSNPLQTLLNTNALGLRAAGVASDSALRLLSVLGDLGIPASFGTASHSTQDRASVSAAFNLTPTTSSTGSTYALNVNASWSRSGPLSASTTTMPSFATRSGSRQASVQLRHSAYFTFFLSETTAGVSGSASTSDPFLALPAARVRVSSEFEDEYNGVTNLSIGGNPGAGSSSRRLGANATNSISWFSLNNKHRLKLTTELNYSASSSEQASNYLGTYTFNSIEDLAAAIPASYSRQLDERRNNSAQLTDAISLGDAFRVNPDFQLQYGVRLDGGRYFDRPRYNPAVESAFGVRNDFVPTRLYWSPRIGFSWTLGKAEQVTSFAGAASPPRAIVRGGIAVQQSALGSISSVLNNTGLPGSIQSLNCVGDATPEPEWDMWLVDPGLVPDECADGTGATLFSSSAPGVTLYNRNFSTPRSVRSNLSWQRSILDRRFNFSVAATHSLNGNRGSQVDLNFDPTVRFTLENESGRPVFVQPSSIVPRSGAIASRDARISQDFSRVNELRSDLRSESVSITARLTPGSFVPIRYFSWRLAYTYQQSREQQRGFSSTVGNPLEIHWSPGSNTARHQITYNLGYFVFRAIGVGWNGNITSGRPFTPMISGDVNGDGNSNDRAFIYDPATTADPQLAAAMQRLLSTTSPEARQCLLAQLGQLALRNSCRGRWNITGDLMIRFDAARLNLPNRTAIEFSFQNPLGGLDLLLHGSSHLRGWGQGQQNIDNTLLYVRGFDEATKTFRYEVNERFGTPRRSLIKLRQPVRITALVKMDFGPVRERQNLDRNLAAGRTRSGNRLSEAQLKAQGVGSIPNPITSIMRQAELLQLTRAQEDSMARLNRRYSVRLDSIWAVTARHLAELSDDYEFEDAWRRYLSARRTALNLMVEIAPHIRSLLTASQWRKLSMPIANSIDVRYLKAVRNGTDVYSGVSLGGGVYYPEGLQ
jgi:hypothetical protein